MEKFLRIWRMMFPFDYSITVTVGSGRTIKYVGPSIDEVLALMKRAGEWQ